MLLLFVGAMFPDLGTFVFPKAAIIEKCVPIRRMLGGLSRRI